MCEHMKIYSAQHQKVFQAVLPLESIWQPTYTFIQWVIGYIYSIYIQVSIEDVFINRVAKLNHDEKNSNDIDRENQLTFGSIKEFTRSFQ